MRYRVYGITIQTDVSLAVQLPPSEARVDLRFELSADPPDDLDLAAHEPRYVEGMRSDGQPNFSFWAIDDRYVIRITGGMDFHCWPDRIVCHLYEPKARYLVEIALFGMVLSLWLERAGVPTLHGAGAVINGRAVAFLAAGGTGKTSTAAACVAAGHPMLSDDLLALEERDGAILARPGYPHFRMWPAQARHFVGTDEGFPRAHPAHEKLRVPVGDRFGSLAAEPAPLARLYLPRRAETADAPVQITPLRARDAIVALMRESFLKHEVVHFGFQRTRLPFLARLLAVVPVCHLVVPNGLDQLPRAVAAIEADLESSDR